MASTRENLLYRVFKDYCKFFYYENQVALFEGRNYELIYTFYSTMAVLRTKDSTINDWTKYTNLLTELVDDFVRCSCMMYPFLKQDENCCNLTDQSKEYSKVVEVFNKSSTDMFDQYYLAYSLVSGYKEADIIEELLIEFNNYMSHFVKHISDETLSAGTSHLYRGCLDGYKDIILENTTMLLSDIDMRDRFIDLRIHECSTIGIKEENKLLDSYKQISENILTIYMCDEKK